MTYSHSLLAFVSFLVLSFPFPLSSITFQALSPTLSLPAPGSPPLGRASRHVSSQAVIHRLLVYGCLGLRTTRFVWLFGSVALLVRLCKYNPEETRDWPRHQDKTRMIMMIKASVSHTKTPQCNIS